MCLRHLVKIFMMECGCKINKLVSMFSEDPTKLIDKVAGVLKFGLMVVTILELFLRV